MLELRNIFLEFDRPILSNISIKLEKGETLGIVGKSGAGKSSLLSIIAGKLSPSAGEVYLDGKSLPYAHQLLIPGYEFAQLVEQHFALDLYHTVFENVYLKANNYSRDKRDLWVRKILRTLGLLKLESQKAITLSGGEKQRLAIARAIATRPTILLLDEPFAHLDDLLKSKLLIYLQKLKSEFKCSMILVSHDGTDLLSLSDHIIHLKGGRISKKRNPVDLYFNPKNKEEALLFGHWNRIEIGNEIIQFRPNQYQVFEFGEIELKSVKSLFRGIYYENHCQSNHGELILVSYKPLQKGIKIVIEK